MNATKILGSLVFAGTIASLAPAFAQESQPADKDPAYTKVITERADKIVATLGIDDSAKAARVRDIIAQQYRNLSAIHNARDAQIKDGKEKAGDSKEAAEAGAQVARDEAGTRLNKLHTDYLARLSAELPPEKVDKVKDGMTYGVVQVTFNAYLKMMPDLTGEQKKQIMAWLVEAREIAMDEGSSDEKHKVFGKYKGRINNYLSAAGYNLKEAEMNLRK